VLGRLSLVFSRPALPSLPLSDSAELKFLQIKRNLPRYEEFQKHPYSDPPLSSTALFTFRCFPLLSSGFVYLFLFLASSLIWRSKESIALRTLDQSLLPIIPFFFLECYFNLSGFRFFWSPSPSRRYLPPAPFAGPPQAPGPLHSR